MLTYFPQLYPGELLAGGTARYALHVCNSTAAQTSRDLYGHPFFRTAVDFPRNLNSLYENIAPFTDLSVDEIIDQLTLFPYYFAYKDERSRAVAREVMKAHSLKPNSINWRGQHQRLRDLKVCRECIADDIKQFGETYWRRSHQVDCVHFCTKHSEPLQIAKTDYFKHQLSPLDALTATTDSRPYLPPLSQHSKTRLLELTISVEQLLNVSWPHRPEPAITQDDVPTLKDVYPRKGCGGRLSVEALLDDFAGYWTEDVLSLLGLHCKGIRKTYWASIYFKTFNSPSSIKHLLLKGFFDSVVATKALQPLSLSARLIQFENSVIRCRNPLASHFDQAVDVTVRKTNKFKETGKVVIGCKCGYQYVADISGWVVGREPKFCKVTLFGSAFRRTVGELKKQGKRNVEISQLLSIDLATVKAVLDRRYSAKKRLVSAKTREAFLTKRSERSLSPLETSRKRNIDFIARDIERSELIKKCAEALYAQSPPVRVTRTKIFQLAKLSQSRIAQRGNQPLTLAMAGSLSEDRKDFLARRDKYNCRYSEQ